MQSGKELEGEKDLGFGESRIAWFEILVIT